MSLLWVLGIAGIFLLKRWEMTNIIYLQSTHLLGPVDFIIKYLILYLKNPKLFPNPTVNKIPTIRVWFCLGTILGLAPIFRTDSNSGTALLNIT